MLLGVSSLSSVPAQADEGKQAEEQGELIEVIREPWKFVRMEMPLPGGGKLSMRLLRPESWIRKNRARPGAVILMEVEEMSARGNARVISVKDAPEPPLGEPAVTALFRSVRGGLVRLRLEDGEHIDATDNHPLYSHDRDGWVPAGRVRPGERLKTADGSVKVVKITPLKGKQPVFNLEVTSPAAYLARVK